MRRNSLRHNDRPAPIAEDVTRLPYFAVSPTERGNLGSGNQRAAEHAGKGCE
jgi:hypothetical protein